MGLPLSWGLAQHMLSLKDVAGLPIDHGPSSIGPLSLSQLPPKAIQWNSESRTQCDPYHLQSRYQMGSGIVIFIYFMLPLYFLASLMIVLAPDISF
jgi:hypothetical protein